MTSPPLDRLNRDEVAAQVQAATPDLPVSAVVVLRQNPDWLVVAVNDEYIFRFTGSRPAAEWLAAEHRLLAAISGRVTARVPEPCRTDANWAFDAYPRIEGDLLAAQVCSRSLSEASRRRIASEIGRFLAELHAAVDLQTAHGLRLPPPGYPPFEPDLLRRTLPLLECDADRAMVREVDRLVAGALPALNSPALLHGDLHGDNLVISADGSLAGVIDFRAAVVADRHIDFRCLFPYEDVLDGAVDAYNRVSPVPVDLRLCQIIGAAYELYDVTWRAEEGVLRGAIPVHLAQVRSRLVGCGLL